MIQIFSINVKEIIKFRWFILALSKCKPIYTFDDYIVITKRKGITIKFPYLNYKFAAYIERQIVESELNSTEYSVAT
jgi:hypothetical protein